MLFWQLILIQVVAVGVLVFVLRRFFLRQATSSLGRLEQLHQDNLRRDDELRRLRTETEGELKAKGEQMNEAIRRLKAEADFEVQRMREETIEAARVEGERIVAEAKTRGERMRAQLMTKAEEHAVTLASGILQRLFSSRVTEGIHRHLVAGLIDELGQLDRERLTGSLDTAEVIVPFPLTEDEKAAIAKGLSSRVGRPVTLKESADPQIIAGMILKLEHLVLDGSLHNKLEQSLTYVREALAR